MLRRHFVAMYLCPRHGIFSVVSAKHGLWFPGSAVELSTKWDKLVPHCGGAYENHLVEGQLGDGETCGRSSSKAIRM